MKDKINKLKSLLTDPNFLTLSRVAVVPVFIVLMMHEGRIYTFFAALFFCIAAATDYLDGFFARKKGLVSDLGKMLDPLADKLLMASAFIMLVERGWAQAWIICLIVGREMAVTGLRSVVAEVGQDPGASSLGKLKTGFQIAAVIPLVLHYPYLGLNMHAIGTVLLWLALVFTMWSGFDYFYRLGKIFKN